MSTDESAPRFPKLNDGNYAMWRLIMEANLIQKKLWTDIIEIEVPTEDDKGSRTQEAIDADLEAKLAKRSSAKLAEARAEIILRVDISQFAHVTPRDPREIWNNLEAVHRARGFASALALRRTFLTAKKTPSITMAQWIGKVKGNAFGLESCGVTVSDLDLILALTLGLPAEYDTMITLFDATEIDQLTVEFVINRLVNEETKVSNRADPGPAVEMALMAAPTAPVPKKFTDRSEITCFFCGKKGHFKSDCEDMKNFQKWKEAQKTPSVNYASIAHLQAL